MYTANTTFTRGEFSVITRRSIDRKKPPSRKIVYKYTDVKFVVKSMNMYLSRK